MWKPCPFRGRAPGQRGPSSVSDAGPASCKEPRPGLDLAQSCRPTDPGPASQEGPTGPTLRANPCPEVTDLDCRFPLPTLFYRLEAPNLGDRMRRWVQAVSKQGHRHGPKGPGAGPPARATATPQAPRAPKAASDPCDFLTCIFHGLALVHGTTQELCRSTATAWFSHTIIPFSLHMISRDHGA